jgi:hypothetical protein
MYREDNIKKVDFFKIGTVWKEEKLIEETVWEQV